MRQNRAVAIVGVFLQNEALHTAGLGEAPTTAGTLSLAVLLENAVTRNDFYIGLRTHYRRSARSLSMQAELLLLVSAVGGVLSEEIGNIWIALSLAKLGCRGTYAMLRDKA